MPDHAQPLAGRRIIVTRAGEAGQRFAAQLRDLGATPLVCPAITIAPPDDLAPLDAAVAALGSYDWLVFTSANAVAALRDRLMAIQGNGANPLRARVGAVGNATAAALRAAGWELSCLPTTQTAEALANALGDVAGRRILFPASAIARQTLPDNLRARGANVTVVTAYRTIAASPAQATAITAQLRAGAIDAITFTSPSTVQGFLPLLSGLPMNAQSPAIVCIGPVTATAAREAGLHVTATADNHSTAGLLDALCAHLNVERGSTVSTTQTNKGAEACSI